MSSKKKPQAPPPLLWENLDTAHSIDYIDGDVNSLPTAFAKFDRSGTNEQRLQLPQHSELHIIRHFTRLAASNFSIDSNMYPLGSCTMKYNPRVSEKLAAMPEFSEAHPLFPEKIQGSLKLLFGLQEILGALSGFPGIALTPAAGAQGELCGVMMMRKYHESMGNTGRKKVIVPDTAHGTNPATVAMCGLEVVTVPSDDTGHVDLSRLQALLDDDCAGMMLTNPNTLGIYETHVREICALVHDAGGLMYGDGANFNAIAGIAKPAELGFDIMHFNLHKTFGTPHGGGGPGAGPIGCTAELQKYLPGPIIVQNDVEYAPLIPAETIGRVKTGYGNFGILLRAYAYIVGHGKNGVRKNSEMAVLKANYLRHLVKDVLPAFYTSPSMHEFVATNPKKGSISTMDIAKALLDEGFHSPTVYFPLTVKEALMIEPTESESFEEIEAFADSLRSLLAKADSNSEELKTAPHSTYLGRLDEVRANRKPVLKHGLST